jgi:steroid 5-alpha reductase family enzyme
VTTAAGFAAISASVAAFLLVSVLLLWLLSIRIRDVSIIDLAYALLVAGASVVAVALGTRGPLQGLLLFALGAWALRFTVFILRRNLGKGEDPRYTKLRSWAADERAFNRLSLRIVFLHQGAVFWVLSMPAQMAAAAPATTAIGPLALAGFVLSLAGLAIEARADAELARFRADPANKGRVLDSGVWRYSRHPNYFGEACVHWGVGLIACAAPWGFLGLVGPLVLNYYLLRVTGVATLEKKMLREKPGYAAYVARTSRFVPLPPRR